MNNEKKIPVIIDTDPGDDDAASILWALASDRVDVKALTVTNGNVGVDACMVNALRVLEVAGRTDIPVFKGAYRPLVRSIDHAEWIHGKDGLGDVPGLPMPSAKAAEGFAPVKMAEIILNADEPITVLALGPLTNVALAILTHPETAQRIREVVFMGGAFRVSGNVSPRASFNVHADPEAAHVVYSSGVRVVQVGLDACDQVTQRVEDLDEIASAGTAVTAWLMKILEFRRYKAVMNITDENGQVVSQIKASEQVASRGEGIGLNDLTTTGYLINPDWFTAVEAAMDVECFGRLTSGETVIDCMGLWGKSPNGLFVCSVNGPELVAQWVRDMKRFKPL